MAPFNENEAEESAGEQLPIDPGPEGDFDEPTGRKVWAVFHEEYFRKVLGYRDRRGELREKTDRVLGELGISTDYGSGYPAGDMDPFTLISKVASSDRKRLERVRRGYELIKGEFRLAARVPSDLNGLPKYISSQAVFSRFTDLSWEFFASAMEYRDDQSEANRERFVRAFDDIISEKWSWVAAPKATVALFGMDPYFYPTLDSCAREYYREFFGIVDGSDVKGGAFMHNLSGEDYLRVKDSLERKCPDRDFRRLSYEARIESERSMASETSDDLSLADGIPEEEGQWWPSEETFRTQVSEEQWVFLLHDPSVFDESSLRVIKQISLMGGDASYKELADKFGFNMDSYKTVVLALCKRVQRATGCKIPDEQGAKYWPIMFLGKRTRGVYAYKLREELAEAMGESQDVLAGIEVYSGSRPAPKEPSPPLKPHPLNTILYGPPGTGKTYSTARMAVEIITGKSLDDPFEEYNRLRAEGRIGFVTFHQSYSYEEFVEGLRPDTDEEDRISYRIQDGTFKEFCNRARNAGAESPSLGLNESPQVWKVSLKGTGDNEIRRDCLEHGHIRIGWSEYGENVSDETAFTSGGKQVLNAFINRMSVGDIVISCYSAGTTDAIGVVTGDYRYDPRGGEYPRYRDVKWIRKFDVPQDVTALNSGKALNLASVYRLDVPVSEVLALAGANSRGDRPSDERFVFIIDEINRGNISRILGELITLLEPSKREGSKEALSATLPYSKSRFSVPSNVYVIGTMNTADRSLVSLDAALRRRFRFREMMPDYGLVPDDVDGVDARRMLEVINEHIEVLYDRDHVIGHAYLMSVRTLDGLNAAFEDQIIPLLQEYFMDDFERIGQVLSRFGGDGSDSMFVERRQCSSQLKNSPRFRYEVARGPFTKEMYLSIYSQRD